MSIESYKDKISSKLKNFFSSKLDQFKTKFEQDIDYLETLKYSFYDDCITELNKLQHPEDPQPQPQPQQEESAPQHKRNPSNFINQQSAIKMSSKKIIPKQTTIKRSITPLTMTTKDNKVGEVRLDKSSDKPNSKENTKELTKSSEQKKPVKNAISITNNDLNKPKKKNVVKKVIPVNIDKKKNLEQKAKKDKDRKIISPPKAEDNSINIISQGTESKFKEDEENEANRLNLTTSINNVTIQTSSSKLIYPIPDNLKESNLMTSLYLTSKIGFLNYKDKFNLIVSFPPIYNAYNSDIRFIIREKIEELTIKKNEIENLLKKYGDLKTYISKEFSPSKVAQSSLAFVSKEEEQILIKKDDIPKEIGYIFQLIYIIIDEKIDKKLPINKLIENLMNVILPKRKAKDLKNLLVNSKDNISSFTYEKYQQYDKIIKDNPKLLSSIEISKLNRPISYATFFLKEVYDFLNLKTTDGIYYFELKHKNNLLKEYKSKIEKYKKLIDEHNNK